MTGPDVPGVESPENGPDAVEPQPGLWRKFAKQCRPTLAYWMETEAHVYGFSIAANVLLSFFPFLIVIFSICRQVLGFNTARIAITVVLDDYFPGQLGEQNSMLDFIRRNLLDTAGSRHTLQIVSLFLLLFTANGIFEPLEVALNRIWGITRNRSFLKNQIVSLGLIFVCGTLALASTVMTGINARHMGDSGFGRFLEIGFFKLAALPISILMLFLVYWLLPNGKVPIARVLPAAFVVGLALELLKYINVITWPLWYHKLRAEYGPFVYSVTIILWSFLGSMVILAGAEWAARRGQAPLPVEPPAPGQPAVESVEQRQTATSGSSREVPVAPGPVLAAEPRQPEAASTPSGPDCIPT